MPISTHECDRDGDILPFTQCSETKHRSYIQQILPFFAHELRHSHETQFEINDLYRIACVCLCSLFFFDREGALVNIKVSFDKFSPLFQYLSFVIYILGAKYLVVDKYKGKET